MTIELKEEIIIPDDIVCPSRVLDIKFSPANDVVAVGDMHGIIRLYNYGNLQEPSEIFNLKVHEDSTRDVCFNETGNLLFSTSADGSITITDLNNQKILAKNDKAHKHGIYSLDVKGNIFVTGDESGRIKVWDMRQQKCVVVFNEHHDYISQLTICDNTIFAAGGDGCMSTWNINSKKVIGISDNMNEDLLSLSITKKDDTLVCGGQSGKLFVWEWDNWEYPKNSLKGHPESIESIITVNKNTIITGSSDGIIRVVQINPHKLLGCVGQHDFPIERLALSRDQNILASSSHSRHIKFWDVGYLYNDQDDEESDETKSKTMVIEKPEADIVTPFQEEKVQNAYNKKKKTKGPQQRNETNPFYKDM
ncbi:WD repeat-containing protein, putative [Entamoeba dispar SAW760]|uniref:WD repeat-containing protein n=1 Tax=Entamoeba dispar (strain ATCC PRA-260 / SAW760) TaxID=370354 RepID=B0EMX2_ENTDS|nr:WD repeat-containing protein, putative [Entamoeba dispar SAW760]EDR24096.1 WD repeat-containing protein, putative [Entamoeba dispar SAW760]|eukprot:EDR24096.1 WD repeat-containing protein, putative [Entamoeba dispar SAW760]